jgi:hypothetical protein
MINVIKNICVAIVCGLLLTWFSNLVESNFLYQFLENNLIMLLIALLAINITTMSVVMVKLREISDSNNNIRFPRTIKEMKISFYEQIALVVVGLLAQILCKSDLVLKVCTRQDIKLCVSVIPAVVLIYAIMILWDTGRSIFVILASEDKN